MHISAGGACILFVHAGAPCGESALAILKQLCRWGICWISWIWHKYLLPELSYCCPFQTTPNYPLACPWLDCCRVTAWVCLSLLHLDPLPFFLGFFSEIFHSHCLGWPHSSASQTTTSPCLFLSSIVLLLTGASFLLFYNTPPFFWNVLKGMRGLPTGNNGGSLKAQWR